MHPRGHIDSARYLAVPINAPITQTSGRDVHNFTDARGDMNQVLGVDKTAEKWLVQVKSPLGTKVFEIPLSRAADEREATTQVEYLMKNNAKLDVALAEMDALVGAVADVGRKVDGLGKKDDEQYKGHTIYPAANSQFAVGVKGIIQKSKFSTAEAAKKWVDENGKRDEAKTDGRRSAAELDRLIASAEELIAFHEKVVRGAADKVQKERAEESIKRAEEALAGYKKELETAKRVDADRKRLYPSYHISDLKKWLAEGTMPADKLKLVEEEIAARESGESVVKVTPQIAPGWKNGMPPRGGQR